MWSENGCLEFGNHESLRGYATQISKNQVENVGKWFLEAKEPKSHKLVNLPVLVVLEADDLCKIFDQSKVVKNSENFQK